MNKTGIVVIGAGAVGLACAYKLLSLEKEIVVMEKHESFGKETSSRNSEVVHAGIYYPPDSLKAKLCVEGSLQLYEFLEKHRVPYRKCGKMIVAVCEEEYSILENLYNNALQSGARGLSLIDQKTISSLEPSIYAQKALLSPNTAIFDTHVYMKTLETLVSQAGGIMAYGCEVTGVKHLSSGYMVEFKDTDGQIETIACEILINSSGLYSDRVAALSGIDIEKYGYKLYHSKGEYYSITGLKKDFLTHLVYPVPRVDSLGIHTIIDLQGSMKLGPNAYYTDNLDYSIDNRYQKDFYNSAKKYLPFLEEQSLVPQMAGIRPKLQGPGIKFADFVIHHETDKSMPGFVNLIGIESPGLTSSLAIGGYVKGLL